MKWNFKNYLNTRSVYYSMYNLHKLNTKEDPYFIHKALGIATLVNFTYRYYLLFFYNSMFLSYEMLLVHAGLSISSLIFHIPKKRHAKLPMIYPEFRLHSIVFALRSILCCLIHLYIEKYAIYYKIGVCFITMKCADLITFYYAEPGDTTMRSMPYSESIDTSIQRNITLFYSHQQINATIYMLFNGESAFSPLFSIQIAAFLMTLVRKNIIYPNTWHILYALSLIFNVFILNTFYLSDAIYLLICSKLFGYLRIKIGLNKYISWSCVFSTYIINTYIINPYIIDLTYLNNSYYKQKFINCFIIVFIIWKLYITRHLYIKYT
jgi:hypothetical protein